MLARFEQLDLLLCQLENFWRIEPFHQSRAPKTLWQFECPDLEQWLNDLSIEQIQNYKSSTPLLLDALNGLLPRAIEIQHLAVLEKLNQPLQPIAKGLEVGIPGKKLSQIRAMGDFAISHHRGLEWLEWCSGKGYLGRILAHHSNQKVTSFEWQEALCISGQKEADEKQLDINFVQGDALADDARNVVKPCHHAVALHACGDLHVKLLQHATIVESEAVTISPCCYHLIKNDYYQVMSEAAKLSSLKLTRAELRIPLQETVTGGERVFRHRQEEMSFRLGFDNLLRDKLGFEEYVAVPSIKKSELSKGFEYFCQWAAEKKNIDLPETDFAYWQDTGIKRFWHMERMSLIQQVFYRPLEVWLALDKAIFLQEKGYKVLLGEFCEREVTPRNILIHAEKAEKS